MKRFARQIWEPDRIALPVRMAEPEGIFDQEIQKGRPEGLPFANPGNETKLAYLPDFAGAEIGADLVPDNTECVPVERT
jgi:hypothetical protein